MGNYSYLLKILNCDNTKINWEIVMKEIEKINKESTKDDTNYLYYNLPDDVNTIKNLANFSKHLNNHKVFGYLTNSYIKSLKQICKNTERILEDKENPKMFFEEEGWNRIHYLEFELGTENIIYGSYTYNFDTEYYIKIFEEEIKNKKQLNCIKEDPYELALAKEKEYINNLIYDKSTNWQIKKLEPTFTTQNKSNLHLLLMLAGLRIEDYNRDPEGVSKQLSKLLNI